MDIGKILRDLNSGPLRQASSPALGAKAKTPSGFEAKTGGAKDNSTIGQPGWTGDCVAIKAHDPKEKREVILAVVRLDKRTGRADSDDAFRMEQWTKKGIRGRPENGLVFPKDGQRFLDELPFHYKSPPYCWAEPIST